MTRQRKRLTGRPGPHKLSRRRFLAGALAAAGLPSVVALKRAWAEGEPATAARHRWVMVIDLNRCDGCKACTRACHETHFVPEGQAWIEVVKASENPFESYPMPLPCMHCEMAPCVKVCPVGASYYDPDGIVLIDHDRCIGCRICMAACPYGRRFFNWAQPPNPPGYTLADYSPEFPVPHRRGTVEKCMFCAHRVKEGQLPACVEACHKAGMNAIYFGDANEDLVSNGQEVVRLSDLLASGNGHRYKEELGTHPRVYYLPRRGA